MPTITITLTNAQATRLQEAWAVKYRVVPSMADVRARIISDLKAIVRSGERKIAERQAAAAVASPIPPFDVT